MWCLDSWALFYDELQKICASAYIVSLTTPCELYNYSTRSFKKCSPPRVLVPEDLLKIMRDTPAVLKVRYPRGHSLSKFTSFNGRFGNPKINYPRHPCIDLVMADFEDDSWMARKNRNKNP